MTRETIHAIDGMSSSPATWRHAPPGYECPLCRNVRERASHYPLEIVFEDADTFVKVNPRWWTAVGGLLVIPKLHVENLYEFPDALALPLQRTIRRCALNLKRSLRCEGVSTRQHNEPAGNQDVWHYHVHVFPRWSDDGLYAATRRPASAADMQALADTLRANWSDG